jgi:hypothetical protein
MKQRDIGTGQHLLGQPGSRVTGVVRSEKTVIFDAEKRPEGKRPQESPFPDGRLEAKYLQKLMTDQMAENIHLCPGEVVEGFGEHYDGNFVRLSREGGANIILFKKKSRDFVERGCVVPS